ncbi:MAG: acyl-CoA dehydrogenase family protein [Eggerthellaceae bacterium]
MTRSTCWAKKARAWKSPSTPSPSPAHIAASNLGTASACSRWLARANDRITFGKPIATRQTTGARLLRCRCTPMPRCMVYDFGREPTPTPIAHIEEKAAMCKLFSIYSNCIAPTAAGHSVATATSRQPLRSVERMYRDARAMWLEEGAPTFSASPLPAPPEVRRRRVSAVIGQPLTSRHRSHKNNSLMKGGLSAHADNPLLAIRSVVSR